MGVRICHHHRIQPRPQVKVIFRYLRPDAPVSLFFRLFTLVHLLIDSSVEGQYITKLFARKSHTHTHTHIYIYIYMYHVTPPARISLTISRYPPLSSIASRLHPVSAQSCYMQVLAGRPVFTHPCEEVNWSMSLMSSSLLLQQCLTCLVRLTWIVFVTSGKWPYSSCFVGYCLQYLFNITLSILVLLPSNFFSISLISVHIVHPHSSIATTSAWKKTSIGPIAYRWLSNPLVVACWCISWLMRHCFLGKWTCILISENYRLVWCRLLD